MKETLAILSKLERPLEFASRDSYAHLKNLHAFEPLAHSVINELSRRDGGVPLSTLIQNLREIFTRYDSLPLQEKQRRIQSAGQEIRRFKEKPAQDNPADTPSPLPAGARDFMDTPIQFMKGVGGKRARLLLRLGIETVRDALFFVPLRYEDRGSLKKIKYLTMGMRESVRVKVIASGPVDTGFRGRKTRRNVMYQVIFGDDTGVIHGKWFNARTPYMEKKFPNGTGFILYGEVRRNSYSGEPEMIHPDTECLDADGDDDMVHAGRIVPVYSLTEGLYQKTLRSIIKGIVDRIAGQIPEYHSPALLQKYGFPGMEESCMHIHFPEQGTSPEQLESRGTPFYRRIIFDEFFFLELGLARKRMDVKKETKGRAYRVKDGELIRRFTTLLPFEFTRAQKRVLQEIEQDLSSDRLMNRLLHGDVGSGKTVTAFCAMLIAVDNGFQAAIMAPTEILAEQHYENIRKWGEALGISIILLTGRIKGVKRREALDGIGTGAIRIIVGTHAVIQEDVKFNNLGLAVVDEQHRFGVMQRAVLKKKGDNCDMLIMTATPIPRTLAMTVYGDLDFSVIDEMPAGRKPVKTKLFFGKRGQGAYPIIEKEIRKGRQVYMVYPLVEESEKLDLKDAVSMAETLRNDIFPHLTIGLVHGRMKGDEKERIMTAFRRGTIQLLVATTVVEVGVDVPNATVMVIEHAERFGLSQLHQLRGRVGRGKWESLCLLIAHYPLSEEGKKRLRVMTQSRDGFYIAEKDLEIRGPGQFLGTRQSGMPEFKVGNIIRDQALLAAAREEAFRLLEADPLLSSPANRLIKEVLQKNWGDRIELGDVG